MGFFGQIPQSPQEGALNFLFSLGNTRLYRIGHSGSYTRTSGTGTSAALGNTGGFNFVLDAGSAASGNAKIGYFNPVQAQMQAGGGVNDYSKKIVFSIGGMMRINSTNSVLRIVFGGTGNTTNAPFENQDGLNSKGFGVEFRLVSSIIQARLIAYNSSYVTPSAYTSLTNGFGEAASGDRFFGMVLESLGDGTINLYGANSELAQNIQISKIPLLTLSGGPTNSTSANRLFEIQAANHETDAPTSTPSAIMQSPIWALNVA
jgi:hypothetical protein